MSKLYVTNAKMLRDGKFVENIGMVVEDGKITAFTETAPKDAETVDCGGRTVIPGFVDIHLHGGGGSEFIDGTPEAFEIVARTHCLHGTTSLCPTPASCSIGSLYKLFDVYREARENAKYCDFLGIHLEGPFLSLENKGAQNANYIISPTPELFDELLERGRGVISRISFAPENEGMRASIEKARDAGIVLAIAHSNVQYEETEEVYNRGVRLITHLFNATTSIRKVNQIVRAGQVEAFYTLPELRAEIIGDGCHVPKQVIAMARRFKGTDNICLITDAMRAAGTDVTESYLGEVLPENRVIIEAGVAKLPDRSFYAGSIATMDRVFRNAVENVGLSIEDTSAMMSKTPARLMGAGDRKGILEVGYDADFLVIGNDLGVDSVFVRGDRKK